jgi:hypothetical protein
VLHTAQAVAALAEPRSERVRRRLVAGQEGRMAVRPKEGLCGEK